MELTVFRSGRIVSLRLCLIWFSMKSAIASR